ncbi:MAG: proprotein convertase P-domain-containing protein, partial [Erythrobacter sp.]|nr:proprotein convertase P-domain-containing protein [Erythrobacter sp.]
MLRALQNLTRTVGNLAFWTLLFAAVWLVDPQAAYAQTTVSVSRSNDGTIDEDQACNASPLVRNFNVNTNFVIGDVDLGVIVNHTWRGDLRITLRSPEGTTVELTNGNVNNLSGDHFNVLLNDEGTQLVNTDGNTVAHTDAQNPPFEHDFIPDNPLSAFDGEDSQGQWRMEICDLFPSADDGTFRYAELFVTSVAPNTADLSLVKTVSNANPLFGSTVSFSLSLTNDGPLAATNVEVTDQLPVGFDFTGATGFGTFDNATGIWSVPTIASGETRVITLEGTVSAPTGVTITNFAEVSASDVPDPDSTPDNQSTNEDDDDSASFTVQGTRTAGIAPTLV